jgi:hypothetical protein
LTLDLSSRGPNQNVRFGGQDKNTASRKNNKGEEMEPKKQVSSAALQSLKEALASIYWYKGEMKSFVTNCLSDPTILSRINWDEYKWKISTDLVDYLAQDQETYLGDLRRLIDEVCKVNNFRHLERLDDGREKARKAKEAVDALKAMVKTHDDKVKTDREIEDRRKKAFQEKSKHASFSTKLEELKSGYYQILKLLPQQRGFEFEKMLRSIFELFDLDPKASFRNTGEQIDGAFTFDGTDFLFEAKWQNNPSAIQDLDAFSGKLTRKLDNTLGLFISMNGFSEDGVKAHSTGRRMMVLMDGSDIMAVLEGRIDLVQLLYRKRRHASHTGNIYLKIHEIFLEE